MWQSVSWATLLLASKTAREAPHTYTQDGVSKTFITTETGPVRFVCCASLSTKWNTQSPERHTKIIPSLNRLTDKIAGICWYGADQFPEYNNILVEQLFLEMLPICNSHDFDLSFYCMLCILLKCISKRIPIKNHSDSNHKMSYITVKINFAWVVIQIQQT